MARIVWLEPVPGMKQERGALPVFKPIDPGDGRLKDYQRWIDTEAGRFARRLVYRASQRFGTDPAFPEPVLPVVVRNGGNNAEYGFAIQGANGSVEEHGALAYVILDPSPQFLGDTVLHESGHVAHYIATHGRRKSAPWSAFVHTTFATSDPVTALSEGYGIHLETLWGHFGSDADKHAYYHRSAPSFESGKGRKGEYFAPVDDLLNFAQVWSRYQAVRDTWPAFEGHVYPGNYARSQMDPARDRSRLKTPNAMLASEGVAASVMFWIADALATENGARPGAGLDQPALVDAEMALLEGLGALNDSHGDPFRPDLLDLVTSLTATSPHVRDVALSRFIDVTRGVTARPPIRGRWRGLYDNAMLLAIADAKSAITQMDAERGEILARARQDPSSLRAGVGPIIPVRVAAATFELKALGEKMPVEFDLNAMSEPELAVLPAIADALKARILSERERAPFDSIEDFGKRTGASLDQLGLTKVDVNDRRRGT